LLLAGIAVQVAAGLAMLVVYAVFGRRLLVILTNEGFDLSTPTIVALAVGRFLQSISQSLQPIFSVHQSLGRVLAFRAGGAVLTVVLCSFAIRTWGVHGAAVGGALAIGLYGVSLVVGPGGVWWLVTRVRRDASRR
jgi:O-antigen/teichoic acid export membrane protein